MGGSGETTMATGTDQSWLLLKSRIKNHYDLCSSYYNSLWGEHIHHGYWSADKPDIPKEEAQTELIELLLSRSDLASGSRVLDVGCGLGGTSRYLARERGCHVTGISISSEQVKMATQMSKGLLESEHESKGQGKQGSVQFVELDAEKMAQYFESSGQPGFDAVWISEALSHFPNKKLFFKNAAQALRRGGQPGGKLVLADWFKNEGLTEQEFQSDVAPIEHGMLLPPLCTQSDYVAMAKDVGFKVFAEPLDISKEVAKTWDISLNLVASPSLWALAFTQGKDFVAFLKAFQAMRTGYKNGTFRYAVVVFELS